MTIRGNCLGILVLSLLVAGCGQGQPSGKGSLQGSETETATSNPAKSRPPKGQTFLDATVAEPPDGELRPPDKTMAGKNVAKMYEQIAGPNGVGGLWDQITLLTPDGKKLKYSVTLKTDLGDIAIEMLPDISPSHVRNFLALCKVGYYEGLAFDRTPKQEFVENDKAVIFQRLEAGCPLGTGELGYGSIGYWLRPELSDKVHHDEGTVGAWHREELETAACKFYITLNKTPWMDGNWTVFGKVTRGLDVARQIFARPAHTEEGMQDRPKEPVIIRAVVVEATPVP